MRRNPVLRLVRFPWHYDRPVTTVAVLVVALLAGLLARALLPEDWRPASALWLVPSALLTYVVLRVDARLQWSKRLKHAYVDRLGGDVDDAQTWLVAALTGATFLLVVAAVQRLLG